VQVKSNPTEHEGIRIFYLRNLSNTLSARCKLAIPTNFPAAFKGEIKDFDYIHIHGHRHALSLIGYYYARKYDIPYLIQAHGDLPYANQKVAVKRIYDTIIGRKILHCAQQVIALNRTEYDCYKKMGVDESKIVIVPNGIDEDISSKMLIKGQFREKYNIKENEKIILYFGRIHKTKNIDMLVETFPQILSGIKVARLVISGPDDGNLADLKQQVQSLGIADRVIFTGYMEDNEKYQVFLDSDVFVTPSFTGFPITFLESLLCGTPIITTANGDNLDWINDNVGRVVNFSTDELRDAIIRLLENDNLYKGYVENGQHMIKETFTWNKVVDQLERDCYKKMNL